MTSATLLGCGLAVITVLCASYCHDIVFLQEHFRQSGTPPSQRMGRAGHPPLWWRRRTRKHGSPTLLRSLVTDFSPERLFPCDARGTMRLFPSLLQKRRIWIQRSLNFCAPLSTFSS